MKNFPERVKNNSYSRGLSIRNRNGEMNFPHLVILNINNMKVKVVKRIKNNVLLNIRVSNINLPNTNRIIHLSFMHVEWLGI